MSRAVRNLSVFAIMGAVSGSAMAATLIAHPGPANNGGLTGWAIFLNLSATGTAVNVTSLTTASTAAANAAFTVEVFTRVGTALGGPVASGPGSSTVGWTPLGIGNATQGAVASGVSLAINTPDFIVGAGQTVGVALRFTGAGPRYFGTGTPAYSTFSDGTLGLVTGDARSAPFTTGGSFFTSRAMVGSITYSPVPEPVSMLTLAFGAAGVALRRRRKA